MGPSLILYIHHRRQLFHQTLLAVYKVSSPGIVWSREPSWRKLILACSNILKGDEDQFLFVPKMIYMAFLALDNFLGALLIRLFTLLLPLSQRPSCSQGKQSDQETLSRRGWRNGSVIPQLWGLGDSFSSLRLILLILVGRRSSASWNCT